MKYYLSTLRWSLQHLSCQRSKAWNNLPIWMTAGPLLNKIETLFCSSPEAVTDEEQSLGCEFEANPTYEEIPDAIFFNQYVDDTWLEINFNNEEILLPPRI